LFFPNLLDVFAKLNAESLQNSTGYRMANRCEANPASCV
jgi:hypothetical protein